MEKRSIRELYQMFAVDPLKLAEGVKKQTPNKSKKVRKARKVVKASRRVNRG